MVLTVSASFSAHSYSQKSYSYVYLQLQNPSYVSELHRLKYKTTGHNKVTKFVLVMAVGSLSTWNDKPFHDSKIGDDFKTCHGMLLLTPSEPHYHWSSWVMKIIIATGVSRAPKGKHTQYVECVETCLLVAGSLACNSLLCFSLPAQKLWKVKQLSQK